MSLTTLKGLNEIRFIQKNLSLNCDKYQAQQEFTKLIKESHGSLAVKLNFLIHTAAQYLSGTNVGVAPLPQLERKTVDEVGRPFEFQVETHEKRITENYKHFVYKICVKWPSRTSYIYRTWEEFVQYKDHIMQELPRDYPDFCGLTGTLWATNQTTELATCRMESIFTFLAFVQEQANNDIRIHSATISFLHEDEKVIKNTHGNTLLPIAITGGKIKLNFKLNKSKILLLVEHCQDLPTINNTAPEPYVKTYLLNKNKVSIYCIMSYNNLLTI